MVSLNSYIPSYNSIKESISSLNSIKANVPSLNTIKSNLPSKDAIAEEVRIFGSTTAFATIGGLFQYDIRGIAIQQIASRCFEVAYKEAEKKLSPIIKNHVTTDISESKMAHTFASISRTVTPLLVGQKVAEYAGYEAPFYLLIAGAAGITAAGVAAELTTKAVKWAYNSFNKPAEQTPSLESAEPKVAAPAVQENAQANA